MRRQCSPPNPLTPPLPSADAYEQIRNSKKYGTKDGQEGCTGGDRAPPPPIFNLIVSFGFPSAGGDDAAVAAGAAVGGFLGGLRSVRAGAILPVLSSRLLVGAQGAGGH